MEDVKFDINKTLEYLLRLEYDKYVELQTEGMTWAERTKNHYKVMEFSEFVDDLELGID